MSSLRLVTFDLDDTLWDVAPVMNNAEALLREWLASNAARLGPVPIEHLWAIRTRLLDREPMLRHRLSELRRRILFHALLDAGYPQAEAESLAEAGFQVFLEARHRVTLFPEVHRPWRSSPTASPSACSPTVTPTCAAWAWPTTSGSPSAPKNWASASPTRRHSAKP